MMNNLNFCIFHMLFFTQIVLTLSPDCDIYCIKSKKKKMTAKADLMELCKTITWS